MPNRFRFLALLLLLPAAFAQNRPRSQVGAWWVAPPDAPPNDYGVYHFRRTLELPAKPASFVVRVSADNRYKLYVNGTQVSVGPARGDILHWRYETVDLAPHMVPGKNVLAAVVWNFAADRPLAQNSHRTGFLLEGEREHAADTGASWKCIRNEAYRPIPYPRGFQFGYYVVGPGDRVEGSRYPWGWERPDFDDASWRAAKPISRPAMRDTASGEDWWLVPRSIPLMEQTPERIGTVRRARGITPPADFPAQPAPFQVPPRTRAVLMIDRTHLTTAYPELVVSGGKGARIELRYAETLRYPGKRDPGNRNDVEGKETEGNSDEFVADGGRNRLFSTLWWRTWRYLELTIDTRDEALTVEDLRGVYTGYPFERKARFDSDSAELQTILDTGWRTARLCAHETYVDCPYYEQLQYVGDTRIQSLISLFNTGDDRLMRNAIEQIDDTRHADFITMSRAPSWVPQYIPGFSLWWIGMVHDHWWYRDDPEFVRRMLSGVRANLQWFARLQRPMGSLGFVPFWDIVDDTRRLRPGEEETGWAPIDLQLLLAYGWSADLEEAHGSKGLAADHRAAAAQLRRAVENLYYDSGRRLFADTPEKKLFSQATNALALLAGVAKPAEAGGMAARLLDDKSLRTAGLYFKYYVHLAAIRAGLGDRYLDQLGPWRRMLANGFSTWGEFDTTETRSDCHAWSASPNIELFRTVLGVDSAAPGFRRVIVRPSPGNLTRVSGAVPHPNGEIAVKLTLKDGKLDAEVTLPPGIDGDFEWRGHRRPLHPGSNQLSF
jgi:hypothetical protein